MVVYRHRFLIQKYSKKRRNTETYSLIHRTKKKIELLYTNTGTLFKKISKKKESIYI